MDNVTQQIRTMKWAAIIQACNNSGVSKERWIMEHNVNRKTFYRYQKYIRENLGQKYFEQMAAEHPELAELAENRSVAVPIAMRRQIDANDMQPEPFHPDAVICMNGIRVGLSNTASPQFIEAVIRCLSHAE